MGLSFDATFTRGSWRELKAEPQDLSEPWLRVQVHDSDIAWLTFAPSLSGIGQAYVFQTARAYFEDETIPITDADLDAAELTAWLLGFWPECRGIENLDVLIRSFVVDDGQQVEEHASPFAERRLAQLLLAVHMPLPPSIQ